MASDPGDSMEVAGPRQLQSFTTGVVQGDCTAPHCTTLPGPGFLTPDAITLLGLLTLAVLLIRNTVAILDTGARAFGALKQTRRSQILPKYVFDR